MVHLAGGEGRAAAVARVVQGEHGVAGARGGQQRRQLVKTGRGVEVAVQGHPLHRGCTGTGRQVPAVTSNAGYLYAPLLQSASTLVHCLPAMTPQGTGNVTSLQTWLENLLTLLSIV